MMRIFVGVAEAEGFAPAARRLNVSAPAATRAVAALEDRLGARLFHRTTRRVGLTEAGRRFLVDAKRILGEIVDAEASVKGAHGQPTGPLGITAPATFGRLHVAPIVLDYARRYPEVQPRLFLADRVIDLIDEGFDVAVRIGTLTDPGLTQSRVGQMRRVVCASPSYFARHGEPRRPEDLQRFQAIAFSPMGSPRDWSFVVDGRPETVRPPIRLIANTAEVAVMAAAQGHGITSVLYYQAAQELRAGKLKEVLQDFALPPIPVHVVHREGQRANARVRTFVDLAVERLRADKVLQ